MSNIRNGRRVPVEFGRYSGEAGVQDREGGAIDVAFRSDARALRDVSEGTIDGDPVEVIEVVKSQFVPGMVVLTCRPAAS